MIRSMPVTSADFTLQGRLTAYREKVTEVLIVLDEVVREAMEEVNREKLSGTGEIKYEAQPPRWSLLWKKGKQRFEVNLMAFAQGGAFVIHGRTGLDRPFRGWRRTREEDKQAIKQEVLDQMEYDAPY
jgi:hypothetical protein